MSIVGFAAKEYRTRGLETCFGSSSADDVCLELVRVGVEQESVVRWKVHFRPYSGDSQIFVTPFQGQVKFSRGDCGGVVLIRVNEIAYIKTYLAKQRDKIEQKMFSWMWGEERSFAEHFEFDVHLEEGDDHTTVETVEDASCYASTRVTKRPLVYTPWHYLSWYILKTRSFGIVITICILFILFGIDLCNMYMNDDTEKYQKGAEEFSAFIFLFELLLRCGVGGSTYAFTTKSVLDVAVIVGLFANLAMEGSVDEYISVDQDASTSAKYAQYGRYLRSASRASRVVKLPQLLGYLTDAALWFAELFGCVAVAYMNYRIKQYEIQIKRRQREATRKALLDVKNNVQLRVSGLQV
jgi:hypothetical protein